MDIQDTIHYKNGLELYLIDGIDYNANTISKANVDDLKQLAQDSYHAGYMRAMAEPTNENSGLHLQRVMHRKSFLEERIAYTEKQLKQDRNSEEVESLEYDLYGFKQQLAAVEYVLYGA